VIGNLRRVSLTLFVILLALGFFASREDPEVTVYSDPSRFDGFTMGTTYSVQFAAKVPPDVAAALEKDTAQLLGKLDKEIFSTYVRSSEISRLSQSSLDAPVQISTEMAEVLQEALKVAAETDGAFDVTIAPLVNLWGFGPQSNNADSAAPSQSSLRKALDRVDYRALVLDVSALTLARTSDVEIDLSAIAKGYAVDRVAELLEAYEINDFFVEVGGELRISGHKDESKRGWVPAIEAPLSGLSQIYEIFLSRGDSIGVAGSGDYRNYFEVDGVRYSHEIDPRSGRPIEHTLAAVTVIDESAMRADALATAYMIMGVEAAKKTADAVGQAAYFIVRSGLGASGEPRFEAQHTEAFARYLVR